jgi:hypothetical protein
LWAIAKVVAESRPPLNRITAFLFFFIFLDLAKKGGIHYIRLSRVLRGAMDGEKAEV